MSFNHNHAEEKVMENTDGSLVIKRNSLNSEEGFPSLRNNVRVNPVTGNITKGDTSSNIIEYHDTSQYV
jgi:hypothetical protein